VNRPPRRRAGGLPDVRDGLTRLERIVLLELRRAASELGRPEGLVPTTLLYGRVAERIDVTVDELQATLRRLSGSGNIGRR
jgi:hypothetical protein